MADANVPTAPIEPVWLGAVRAGMVVFGLGLMSAGAWMAWRPAGLLLPGLLLFAGGVLGALRSRT